MGNPVTPRSAGNDGPDLNSLAQGRTYDYELLWTSPGLSAPYAHGTGQITVGVATPTTRTVSYQQLITTPLLHRLRRKRHPHLRLGFWSLAVDCDQLGS